MLHRDILQYILNFSIHYKLPNGKFYRNNLPAKIDEKSMAWYRYGVLHRDNDLPAVIYCMTGELVWYKNGSIDRDNKPAIIKSNMCYEWYKNNKLHRDNDLPAVVWYDGHNFWYTENKLYRNTDRPSIISLFRMSWYKNNKRHRDNDLPAEINVHGNLYCYIGGFVYKYRDKFGNVYSHENLLMDNNFFKYM